MADRRNAEGEPALATQIPSNMPASHVAIFNDLRGPSNSLTVREASNSLTIGEATAAIRRGSARRHDCRGDRKSYRTAPIFARYSSRKNARDRDPASAMARPFESDRDGVVLGEGAAAFVLESLEHAQRRGATPFAEVIAVAGSAVGPSEGRDFIRIATRNVLGSLLERAKPQLVAAKWHLHAAGKGDPEQDISEALGIHDCLGDGNSTPIVAAKSYFGSLGAGVLRSRSLRVAWLCWTASFFRP